MKTRKIHDVVDKIKANPPKPRKPRPPKPTLLPIPKEQSPTAPSPPTPTGHSITSPSRKMIPPSKSYVPIQPTPPKASDWKYAAIPSAKPVVQNQPLPTQTSNHMMSRKRSHDGGQVQQNGIDGKILEIIRFQDVLVYSSARAWTSVILARKHGSRRHSTAGTFSEIRELNGDVTRDDSQRRLLEQRDVATLVWIAATLFQRCNSLFRRRLAKQQPCTCIVHFCRHCTTTTWKCRISRFMEGVNSRQRLFFSFPELRYSLLELKSKKYCQHLTNWMTWNKRDQVWSSAASLYKWHFRSCCRRFA